MFNIIYVFAGFLVGMIITTVFIPPMTRKKLLPDVRDPSKILKNPVVENGCFRAKAYQISCTAEVDALNK
jgi:hypothetical protein